MQEESQVVLVFVVSSLIIVLILILVILFVVAYQKRIANQRHALDEAEKEHRMHMLQATLEAQERERKRIASDLHDDIGSLLSALKLSVTFLEENEGDEKRRQFLSQTRNKLDSGIEQVRRISHDIYPPALQKLGLWEALNDVIGLIQESGKIRVIIENKIEKSRFDAQTELAVYRVLQELLNNALRHSQASEIKIRIFEHPEGIRIIFLDNGIGMSLDEISEGLGFVTMRSRMKVIQGRISFQSQMGSGSIATLTFKPTRYENSENKSSTGG